MSGSIVPGTPVQNVFPPRVILPQRVDPLTPEGIPGLAFLHRISFCFHENLVFFHDVSVASQHLAKFQTFSGFLFFSYIFSVSSVACCLFTSVVGVVVLIASYFLCGEWLILLQTGAAGLWPQAPSSEGQNHQSNGDAQRNLALRRRAKVHLVKFRFANQGACYKQSSSLSALVSPKGLWGCENFCPLQRSFGPLGRKLQMSGSWERGLSSLRGVVFMTVLTVLESTSFCLSYKIQHNEATVAVLTVLAVSEVMAVQSWWLPPLNSIPLFHESKKIESESEFSGPLGHRAQKLQNGVEKESNSTIGLRGHRGREAPGTFRTLFATFSPEGPKLL